MKVTIIYSNPASDKSVSNVHARTVAAYSKSDEIVGNFNLTDRKLKYCTGCWSCWWKTPGECSINDGIEELYRSVVSSDLLLFIAPLTMGLVSSELKKFIERMIPLIHPYMGMVDGEVHHRKRYSQYPDIAAVLIEEADTDDEDREINNNYFSRLVKNFYSRVSFIEFRKSARAEEHK